MFKSACVGKQEDNVLEERVRGSMVSTKDVAKRFVLNETTDLREVSKCIRSFNQFIYTIAKDSEKFH